MRPTVVAEFRLPQITIRKRTVVRADSLAYNVQIRKLLIQVVPEPMRLRLRGPEVSAQLSLARLPIRSYHTAECTDAVNFTVEFALSE